MNMVTRSPLRIAVALGSMAGLAAAAGLQPAQATEPCGALGRVPGDR